ncbi:Ger(x)C family spore germination protein [Acetohalobium arabaticum]|uniref:Germination protein, Ger(X)C family n=1 Tax=Acetohalobium arabaticum (strain ATCC 49924 / DSM 5501 / Z-7288) TaxID=574087 RepID=D9QSI1_ACEAZ|nr:Ger(x)C family spore germination protein [Acetohalobium arabaticum]ADL13444.1 germination protein, Ger(x)C family [Acetohalobium arabaticum DSM 5501]
MINGMIKKILILLILIFTVLPLTGCWDIREIEQTQFPSYITVDKAKEEVAAPYLYSLQFPILRPKAPKKVNNLSVTAYSIENAINNLQNRSVGVISLGMLKTIIFSKEVAKEGLLPQIDALWRNPLIPGSVLLAITPKQAAKIKKVKVPTTENRGQYLDLLFRTTSRNTLLPERNLTNFFSNLKTTGIEPVIPIIKYGKTDIKIIGTALFRKDKMIGKLQVPETRSLALLKENFSKGEIALKVDNHIVTYYVQQTNSQIKPSYHDGKFTFNINLELDVDVVENTSSKRLTDNKTALANMERHLESALKKEIDNLFTELQKYKSDAIGIGRRVKVKDRELLGIEIPSFMVACFYGSYP